MPITGYQALKVFRNDVTEWVVANDVEDARVVLSEYYREMLGEPDTSDMELAECLPDKLLTIDLDDGRGSIEMTCAEWAVNNGRGFLASTEY